MRELLSRLSAGAMVLSACLTASAATEPLEPLKIEPKHAAISTNVSKLIEELHYSQPRLDDSLSSAILDEFLDTLDGNRMYFTAADVGRFSRLRYTLDFREQRIEWHEHVVPTRGAALQLAFEHGRFLVNLPQRNHTLRLVPDSGAGGLILFNRADRIGADLVGAGHTVELYAAQASRRGRAVRLRELRLGDRMLWNIPAVVIEREQLHPAEGDGLLPLHLFDRVTFDGPGRRLILG